MARNTVTPSTSSTGRKLAPTSQLASNDDETRSVLDQIQRSLTKMRSTDTLTVKCKHQSETRMLTIKKPANVNELRSSIVEAYKKEMAIFYMLPNLELTTPIRSQEDLDAAVKLIDNSEKPLPLRLFLTDLVAPVLQQNISSQTNPSAVKQPIVMGKVQQANAATAAKPAVQVSSTSRSPASAAQDVKFVSVAKPPTLTTSISSTMLAVDKTDARSARNKADNDAEVMSLSSQTSNDSGIKVAPRSESSRQLSVAQYTCQLCRNEAKLSTKFMPSNVQAGTFPLRVHPSTTQTRIDVKDGRQTFPHIRETPSQQCCCGHLAYSAQNIQQLAIRTPGSASSYGSGSSTEIDPSRRLSFGVNPSGSSVQSPVTPVNWSIGEFIGGGAIGRVYKCLDKDTGKEFAVKKIPFRMESHDVARQLSILECEIQMLKTFTHERIVQYLGFAFSPDQTEFFVFMEYLSGGSLKQQIRKYGALTEILARKFTVQVLDALQFLHANKIVHRDIKSDNILSDSNGNVKLSDFSAAKQIQTICATSSMDSGAALHSVIGTPYFMAPEVINGDGYSYEADVWSVGCTLVEMLTGRPPYSNFEPMAALFKIVTTDFPDYQLPPNCSNVVPDFLRKTFIRDKKRRPSAADLLKHPFCSNS